MSIDLKLQIIIRKHMKKVFILLITLPLLITSCGNLYNDILDGKDDEYPVYVYVLSTSSYYIDMYSLNKDGSIKSIGTIYTSYMPYSLDVHPSGKYLYVSAGTTTTDTRIQIYGINSDGLLSLMAELTGVLSITGTYPYDIYNKLLVHPGGKYLFASANSYIYIFHIESDGKLNPISYISGITNNFIANSLTGEYIYLVNSSGGFMYKYSVNSGNLQYVSTWSTTASYALSGIAVHPSEGWIYTASSTYYPYGVFAINQEMSQMGFVQLSLSPIPNLAIHPKGNFLYATSSSNCTIAAFHIDKDGNLNPSPASIYSNSSIYPYDIAIHPNGKYLYTASSNYNTVSSCIINSENGSLMLLNTLSTTGLNPTVIKTCIKKN